MISAKIILDSINPDGQRLTSFVLVFPRIILPEFLTHRVLSRNTASSRAIPVMKMVENILKSTAYPSCWGKNKSGMQAIEDLPEESINKAILIWTEARDYAIKFALKLADLGLHKQLVNRIIEPYSFVTMLCSATDLMNFFALRANEDAQPEFQALAYKMLGIYLESVPKGVSWGDWHIPFGDRMPKNITHEQRLKIATARAGRVSYLSFEGSIEPEKDYALHDSFVENFHMSPLEHCAQATQGVFGNFVGWKQYRKFVPGENRVVNLKEIWNKRPQKLC